MNFKINSAFAISVKLMFVFEGEAEHRLLSGMKIRSHLFQKIYSISSVEIVNNKGKESLAIVIKCESIEEIHFLQQISFEGDYLEVW